MNALLVEDDHLQAQSIAEALAQAFSGGTVSVVRSEHAFLRFLEEPLDHMPDVIIMDVMLRWCEPAPRMPAPPPEVETDGYYRAGIRCLTKLLENDSTRHVPVVIYSILGDRDLGTDLQGLPQHVVHLRKDSDLSGLVIHIRSLLPELASSTQANTSWWRRIVDATEAKPGWLGFAIDLKKVIPKRRPEG